MDFIREFTALEVQQFVSNLLKIVIAFVLTFPVAWDREKSTRSVGLRTFPLVGMASCAYVLIANHVLGNDVEAQARIIQGVITGIGFIGGGAILKSDGTVKGTATAASIWATGVIGAASAYSRYEIAILVTICNFVLLRMLTPVKERIEVDDGDER